MSLMSKLSARFGRFAVPNLTLLLIAGQVLLYVGYQINQANGVNMLERVQLSPEKVEAGEYWRLLTFLFQPPTTNIIFAFMFWYLFYLFGTTLEVTWGTLRYNIFLLVGYLATVATAFGISYAAGGASMPVSNGFLYGTVFLAFARLYPEFVLQIFFVLPVKVRWLALLMWIGYAAQFVFGTWMERAAVAASVANYMLFFGRDLLHELKHSHRRMQFQAKSLKSPEQRMMHTCRSCGLTSAKAPQMQFRYCSKCEGDCCYCADHLRNHEHVVPAEATKK